MRRLLLFLLAALSLVACTQNEVEELTANRADVPEALTVGFEGGDTRVELNDALKTVWTKGDEVSVFYFSNANQRWQFQGETGERMGKLKRMESAEATAETTYNVVAYPYDSNYFLNPRTCALHATLPATQHYAVDSYGAGGNIMVAQSEFTQFSLRNVCGWLRVELTGEGEVVKSITLRGNAGEQVAGLIYVDTATAEATLAAEMGEASDEEEVGGVGGGLDFDDTVFTEVTLDCGDGVTLGAEATAFYIALLPQTFEKGMTVEINYANDNSQTLVCENSITISRNHISPINIEASEEEDVVNSQIFYTATALVEPYDTSAFNVAIVSNEWNETTGEGVITFDGELTTIGDYAFDHCDSLTSVTIPDSVTTIGYEAFYNCSSLTIVTIGDSVTTIGDFAFWSCNSLTSVTIGDSVTTIGDSTFLGCGSLTSVTIPDSVTTIGDSAFLGCSSLTSVTIPDSVTTIGEGAFYYCSSLTEFKGKFAADGGRCLIIDGVLNAFALGCRVTEYTIPDSVTTIGDSAFAYCDSLTSVTIPDSVTTIGYMAFRGCDSLASVTIPDSVTTIGDSAFSWCDCLTSVTIPESVTTIGYEAFYNCSSLTSVTIPDSVTTIGYEAFYGCDSLTSVVIPDSVTWINDYAFYGCDSLTSVTIGNSVTTIGDFAFWSCNSLTSVTIPDSVTTIEYGAFGGCSKLAEFKGKFAADGGRCLIKDNAIIAYAEASGTTYTIPDSVTTIGDGAFAYCDYLTSVTIPDSVTTIGDWAFWDCDSLTSVYCKATTPPHIDGAVFNYNSTDRKIYVYEECVDIYKAAWSEYADSIVAGGNIPESVTTTILYTTSDGAVIDASKFPVKSHTYNNGVGELILYGELKAIPDRAFYEFGTLTTITIPDSVTTIGEFAFSDCTSLTSVTIPDSVTMIEYMAFDSCSSLTSVTIGNSVTTIGINAFWHCSSLTSVTIPDSVTTIGDYAFYGCSSLTNVTIPDSVTTIGDSTFAYCYDLTSVTIPESVTTIENNAFAYCDDLTSVTIPESVTTIGYRAFSYCYSLTSVTIPESVTAIGDRAFGGCSNLAEFKGKFAADGGRCLIKDNAIIAYANASGTTYTIPDSVTTIGDWAFYYCYSLTSVTIPDSVTTIGYRAFSYCYSLTSVYCKATTPPSLGDDVFKYWDESAQEYVNIGCPIYVPAESVEEYKAAAYWSDYAADIVGYDFETGEVVE